jgi:GDP-mannose 6-dehydrogenase
MRISVLGLGYVGTVCAACLADRGHTVIGTDKAEAKVNAISAGRSPIIERDIQELVGRTVKGGSLSAMLDGAAAVAATDLSIVCVGTPSQPNGALDLAAVKAVSTEIGQAIRSKTTRHVVVVRSTVTPGTTRGLVVPRLIEASGKNLGEALGVAFNPEFMREGSSVSDFNTPSKTVVGPIDDATGAAMLSLYKDLPGPKIITKVETAELIKYVDNSWHALKVAFANEIGVLGSALDIDSHEVMRIFCEDKRLNISTAYLRPGFAFGGSCLPKDLRALTYLGRTLDLTLPLLNHILDSNRMVVERGVNWILAQSKKRVAFLGISFKSGTDDVRESPFVEVIERIVGKGCEVRIFDPNVHLARMVGANRDYLLQVLPHIAELVVPKISDAVAWADTIVVTSADPVYTSGLAKLGQEQIVLDFAHLADSKLSTIKPYYFHGARPTEFDKNGPSNLLALV